MGKTPRDTSSSNAHAHPDRPLHGPVYSQPTPTEDPTIFRIEHPSDQPAYDTIKDLNAQHKIKPLPFPKPRGAGPEPKLTLSEVFGGNDTAIKNIEQQGQIVFHSLGDCGSTKNPHSQNLVTDKMVADFDDHKVEKPQFALLLGDIVYSFGESQYYYDQFYEPYRNYHAPVLAAAGNHDGMVSPLAHAKSLDAYLRNFCCDPKAQGFVCMPEAGGLSRTAQIQPGVFFTFEAPFVRVLVFYTNTLEDPGVIANDEIGHAQLDFLEAALKRVQAEKYQGALLFAHHHPPYAIGGQHSSSTEMRAMMDKVCAKVGVWPHAVLAGHAHSYQRFTRHRADGTEIPYIICGNGGHNVSRLIGVLRTPQIVVERKSGEDEVTFENYDDQNYGYLRVIAGEEQLRIEYHPASDGRHAKTPDDFVTVDLKSRKRTLYKPNNLGYPKSSNEIQQKYTTQSADTHRTRSGHRS
jgi:hypothetical protein